MWPFGIKVYCQTCNNRVQDWGYISDVGKLYHVDKKCVPEKDKEDKEVFLVNKKEIQQTIKTGKLKNYNLLENMTK